MDGATARLVMNEQAAGKESGPALCNKLEAQQAITGAKSGLPANRT